jgi:hypothetical protein
MSDPYSVAATAPLTSMASAMLFGTLTFTTAALVAKSVSLGDYRALQAAQNPRSSPLDIGSFTSIYTLLHHGTIMGVILLYAYICENHPPYPHGEKSYDRDEFFFLTALLLVASAFTLKSHVVPTTTTTNKTSNGTDTNPQKKSTDQQLVAPVDDATEVLNRDQTEEWKGWMQFMFLLYHYYDAAEVYNAIRVMITCYVWMTGFGNFSFFYLKADYSAVRVLQMVWRLNFLVVFLCLTQGTTYILYYICLLHTYFFFMVYLTMRIAKHVNYTMWGMRLKLGVLALIIFFVWDLNSGIFQFVHYPFLGQTPVLGAKSGEMYEWYFRSSLDHWSTFLGMVFALNFPITSLFFRKLEALPLVQHIVAKGAVAVGLLVASYLWVTGPFQNDKVEYNATHAYFGCIPLIAYIYFRNITPWLRRHTLELLHQIGKTTLETYLLQHHIWLTSNAKSLLTLIPGWPKMNFLVVTVIYFVLSRWLYHLTLFLRGMVLPNDRRICIRNLVALGATIGSYILLAFLLRAVGMLNLSTVALCSVGSGFLLYRAVVARTWDQFVDSSDSKRATAPSDVSNKNRRRNSILAAFSPAIGSVAVLLLGISWHHMSIFGAAKIRPLPSSCDSFVQMGAWIPFDACNENSRGVSYREFGVGSIGTCSQQNPSYAWGWKTAPPSSHCRFTHRDSKSLLKALNHRNVTFIGDSVIRHLYHSACRQMGDTTAGAYNTSGGKWTDFSRQYGKASLEFRWAPYTSNQTDVMRRVLEDTQKPDLIVLGGGAWDRLNKYRTKDELEFLRNDVQSLVKEMERVQKDGVPLVWSVPTTMNTWALPSEEKRENIKEVDIAAVRELFKDAGIHKVSSFVLDGPSYTADRVTESYDGVHYPLSVYDGGAQILANAMDWLLPERDTSDPFTAPRPGKMAKPFYGLVMLAFVLVGLLFFDGFLGASYLAALFVPSIMPSRLFEEAFGSLHQRKKLPEIKIEPLVWHIWGHSNDDEDEDGEGFSMRSVKSKNSDARDLGYQEEMEAFFTDSEESEPDGELRV